MEGFGHPGWQQPERYPSPHQWGLAVPGQLNMSWYLAHPPREDCG